MTSPADHDVDSHLSGLDPTSGDVLAYQAVAVRARTVWNNIDGKEPFQTNYGSGPVPNTAATYDGVTGTAEQIAFRYICAYGIVWEPKKVQLLLIEWFRDGCPTNLTPAQMAAKIAGYITNAEQLRPWPAGFKGAMPGEPTKTYPPFPPPA
jgi:hypothetical protein